MNLRIDIEARSKPEDLDVLLNGLKEYNIEQTQEALTSGSINIFVRDESHAILGGLKSYAYLQTLHIDYLYIDKSLRGLGYGKKLLALAETEAKKQNCSLICLSSFSFQAPNYYKKLGYEVYAELDLPTGDKRIYLKKTI
ncbi:MAG: GNAT family N-acetyltransferase [Gammaproteobacteria bacterium]|nr:GNAT family N-acetyltransferase [Gammaproteobacteria bacterium]